MTKLKPSVRASGGTPVGFPDYRPFNKLSRDEQREMLRPNIIPEPLYQVWVDDITRGTIPVGPKIPHSLAVEFRAAINNQIRLGAERTWSNPSVLPVVPIIG